MIADLSAEDRLWIEKLQASVWTHHPATRSGYAYSNETRSLTNDEFQRLFGLAKIHQLPCVMGVGVFGFGLSITIYAHPSAPGEEAEYLICVTDKQLPETEEKEKRRDVVDRAWETWTPYTHSDRARELVELYELEKPRERGYYEY